MKPLQKNAVVQFDGNQQLELPNQVKLSERLAELYGASFGIGVSKKAINIGLIFL